jgi:hypothetical protein
VNRVREEGDIDPNRDFPFAQDPSMCMRSFVGRALNEVWLDHLFQLAITFHGGMQAIAYEWGSPNHEVRKATASPPPPPPLLPCCCAQPCC